MSTDILAAVKEEMNSIMADFGIKGLTKIVLITIKAVVLTIVRVVQKQVMASVDRNKLDKNILKSRYKEDELEQYSQKENICISRIEEEQTDEETEDPLVEKVCKLAAAAGTTVKENNNSIVHRLGKCKVAGQDLTQNN